MISSIASRGVMAGLVVGMMVAGSPGVFAEEPAAPVEAAKPDPAKAKEELTAILKEWYEAKAKGDKKAQADAQAKLDKWRKDNAKLIGVPAELAAKIVFERQRLAFLAAAKDALAQADPEVQLEALRKLKAELETWRDAHCTKEGAAKDGLFQTSIYCNYVNDLLRQVGNLILTRDKTITAVASPTMLPVAYTESESVDSLDEEFAGVAYVTASSSPTPTPTPTLSSTSTYRW